MPLKIKQWAEKYQSTPHHIRSRYMGSFSLVVGYLLLLYGPGAVALPVRLFGNLCMLYFARVTKMRDVALMQMFFAFFTAVAMIPLAYAHIEQVKDGVCQQVQCSLKAND